MKKILALIDFSDYTVPVVKAAYHWSMLSGAEFHVLHKAELILPGFVDSEIKEKWGKDAEKNVVIEINDLLKSAIGAELPEEQIHVTTQRLLPFFSKIITQYDFIMIFVGVKGNGILKNIFIGNTVLKIIDNFSVPVAAIPKHYVLKTPLNLYVAVNDEHGFSTDVLRKSIGNLMLHSIQFISVMKSGGNRAEYEKYLRTTSAAFPKIQSGYKILEGEDVFTQLKALMVNHKNALLVVQKGSRTYSDMISRKFLVNELVNDANIPLVVLP